MTIVESVPGSRSTFLWCFTSPRDDRSWPGHVLNTSPSLWVLGARPSAWCRWNPTPTIDKLEPGPGTDYTLHITHYTPFLAATQPDTVKMMTSTGLALIPHTAKKKLESFYWLTLYFCRSSAAAPAAPRGASLLAGRPLNPRQPRLPPLAGGLRPPLDLAREPPDRRRGRGRRPAAVRGALRLPGRRREPTVPEEGGAGQLSVEPSMKWNGLVDSYSILKC